MSETGRLEPSWVVLESAVEALFVRALGSRIARNSQCLAELKQNGIDPTARLKPTYPAAVYQECMYVVQRYLYPGEPREIALRKMGRETTEGFYRTVIGTAIGAVLKLLPPERMIPRLPKSMVSSSNYMRAEVEQKGPRHFELHVFGSNHPDFVAGAVERGVEQTGARCKVEILRSAPLEAWYTITW